MAFKNVEIPLKIVTGSDCYLLTNLSPSYAYENNVRTNTQNGFRAEVVEMANYEKFVVKITNLLPNVTPAILKSANSKIFVKFTNPVAKPYAHGGHVEYSITADNLDIVDKSTERRQV